MRILVSRLIWLLIVLSAFGGVLSVYNWVLVLTQPKVDQSQIKNPTYVVESRFAEQFMKEWLTYSPSESEGSRSERLGAYLKSFQMNQYKNKQDVVSVYTKSVVPIIEGFLYKVHVIALVKEDVRVSETVKKEENKTTNTVIQTESNPTATPMAIVSATATPMNMVASVTSEPTFVGFGNQWYESDVIVVSTKEGNLQIYSEPFIKTYVPSVNSVLPYGNEVFEAEKEEVSSFVVKFLDMIKNKEDEQFLKTMATLQNFSFLNDEKIRFDSIMDTSVFKENENSYFVLPKIKMVKTDGSVYIMNVTVRVERINDKLQITGMVEY